MLAGAFGAARRKRFANALYCLTWVRRWTRLGGCFSVRPSARLSTSCSTLCCAEVRPMKSSSRTVINHPADRINLAQWLSTMTDREYQACSRAHRAAGTFREGGTFGMVNVESIGGHLLVQHYYSKAARGQSRPHAFGEHARIYHACRSRHHRGHLEPRNRAEGQ
jgi:hypothetical protein